MPTDPDNIIDFLVDCSDANAEELLQRISSAARRGAMALSENRELRAELERIRKEYSKLLEDDIRHAQAMSGIVLTAALQGAFTGKKGRANARP